MNLVKLFEKVRNYIFILFQVYFTIKAFNPVSSRNECSPLFSILNM